ncbi:hypothetical protein A3D88_00030 [Candidatus Peribacteria bacterium RIFCSPHIGHO2_02_FULL_52_16]|nr:MAG: hypothetical protein A2706_04875 [Candidatus Peribacteria bacterium RIFCSPHIGHO2_01_FULL_51_35]OGJ61513.1 MAG: hypothetical protein A3D88_00030 [Candidatus Peribacteria bacterium RIFCSPHIGHO2_02_FULL_52_16]
MHIKRSDWLIFLALMVLPFLVFGRSLFHDFAPIDDWFLIVENLSVHGITFANLKAIFTTYDPELYIPFTLLTFQINYVMAELQPFVYHLTNILLHGANGVLVYFIFRRSTLGRSLPFVCALIFLLHPIQTETVVWIAGRKDLLSTFFYLLSFLFYVRYRNGIRTSYALSVIFFVCALLSKAMAMTLPAVLILYDLLIARRRIDRTFIADKIPYVLLSILFIVIALGGKERVIGSSSALDTILMAGKSSVFYIQQIFLPWNFSVYYPQVTDISLLKAEFFIPLLLVLAAIALAIFFHRKHPMISFGILFYFITLSPTFLNFHKGQVIFFAVDRYAYLPFIGILLIIIAVINPLFHRIRFPQKFVLIMSMLMILLLSILSIRQTEIWETGERLFSHALGLYPRSLNARIDLARIHRERGEYQKAFDLLKEGLALGDHSALRLNAGVIYARTGDVQSATEQFEKAKVMDPLNPEPHFYLGSLWEQTNNPTLAREAYTKAVELDPSYVIARIRLAQLLIADGEIDEAKTQLQEAIRWNPNSVEAREALNKIL